MACVIKACLGLVIVQDSFKGRLLKFLEKGVRLLLG